eukprot:820572-Rhodomonas_salina.3
MRANQCGNSRAGAFIVDPLDEQEHQRCSCQACVADPAAAPAPVRPRMDDARGADAAEEDREEKSAGAEDPVG